MQEIAIYAQKRSGHHAVINWLRYQLPGLHLFLNACEPTENPLKSCSIRQSRIGFKDKDIRVRRALLNMSLKLKLTRWILYNYEDYLPSIAQLRSWFEKTSQPVLLIVLRSPMNLVASRMKWELSFRSQFETINDEVLNTKLDQAAMLWLQMARLSLREDVISIYFDQWVSDLDYKRKVMERLSLPHIEPQKNEIAQWGPGSSFNGKTSGNAHGLDVLNRWEVFRSDPRFTRVINRWEIKETLQLIDNWSPGAKWLFSL